MKTSYILEKTVKKGGFYYFTITFNVDSKRGARYIKLLTSNSEWFFLSVPKSKINSSCYHAFTVGLDAGDTIKLELFNRKRKIKNLKFLYQGTQLY